MRLERRPHLDREPDVRWALDDVAGEAALCHADYGELDPVHRDVAADHVARPVETVPPIRVADHRDGGRCRGATLRHAEDAAALRVNAEHPEVVVGDEAAVRMLELAVRRQADIQTAGGARGGELGYGSRSIADERFLHQPPRANTEVERDGLDLLTDAEPAFPPHCRPAQPIAQRIVRRVA